MSGHGPGRTRRAWRMSMRPGAAASMARSCSRASRERCRSTAMPATTGSAGPERPGGALTLAACWVHARRGLETVFDSNGSPIAKAGLDRIAQLYAIEKTASGASRRRRASSIRWTESAPLVNAFGLWLAEQRSLVSPQAPGSGEKLVLYRQPVGRVAGLPARRARRDGQQLRRKSNPADCSVEEKCAVRGPRRGARVHGAASPA